VDEYLINTKVVKSSLFPENFFVIYTSKKNNKYRIGVVSTFDYMSVDKSFSIELPETDLTQRPFVALHPLSTTVSERNSNFLGAGLSSTNLFDDFWVYTVPV
jgi:hypothetical protein